MNRILATGLAAAFAAGLASAEDSGRPSWVGRIFGTSEPASTKPTRPAAPTLAGPLSPEAMAEALQAEQEALLRRLDVCTRLRQTAAESNDAKLLERANLLEEEATALYHSRVARFGVKGNIPKTIAPARANPELTLEQSLGQPTVPNAKNLKPTPPAGKAASAQARPFKEVQP